MQAPTVGDLLNESAVLHALEDAWNDSVSNDPARRHEEGGWIYMNTVNATIAVRRATAGTQAMLDLGEPPIVPDSVVVATFHTLIRIQVLKAGNQVPASTTPNRPGSSACLA